MITLDVTVPLFLKNFSRNLADAGKQWITDARPLVGALGEKYVQVARGEAPNKSGRFAASITSQVFTEDDAAGFYGLSAKPIGHWIILGTKPHRIAARSKKALSFFSTKLGMFVIVPKNTNFKSHVSNGKLWINKGYVDHPGTSPNPFPKRALERLRPEINKLLERLAVRWVQLMEKSAP